MSETGMAMSMDPHTVLSVVVPLQNDAEILPEFLRELGGVLAEAFRFHEVILVDDGSTDGTMEVVGPLLKEIENIRYLRLSRPFGKDVAVCAGLESSIGDFVVTMQAATDPPAMIPELVARAKLDGGLLHGVVDEVPSRGWLREAGGRWFRDYALRRLGIELHRGSTDFRVLSRQAVNSLMQVRGRERYLRVFTSNLGYHQRAFRYTPNRPGVQAGAGLGEEVATAIDILTLQTRHPLRVVSFIGLLAAGLNLVYMVYVLGVYFLKREGVAEGWTTTSLQLSGMFFFLFLLLAVLGEYVGSLLRQVQGGPLYFVADEKNSSVLLEDTVKSSVIQAGERKEG